jgi:hypothetical protein
VSHQKRFSNIILSTQNEEPFRKFPKQRLFIPKHRGFDGLLLCTECFQYFQSLERGILIISTVSGETILDYRKKNAGMTCFSN